MRPLTTTRFVCLIVMVCGDLLVANAQAPGKAQLTATVSSSAAIPAGAMLRTFQPILPLDNELLQLPSKERVAMLVTLIAPEMEGWRLLVAPDGKKTILDAAGQRVRYYPQNLRVRFSIGTRKRLGDREPYIVESPATADDLQRGLRFRLRRYRGLDAKTIEPREVRVVGMPLSIPYDERIFMLEFQLDKVPVEERFNFEVLNEAGERLGKFGFLLL